LAESPFGLAAWLFDHGDRYAQPAAAITSAVLGRTINGHSAGDLTRDDVLDNFTLYWLTNSAAAHFYWESDIILYNAADVSVPAAVSVFPGKNYQALRSWAESAYHKLIYYNHVDRVASKLDLLILIHTRASVTTLWTNSAPGIAPSIAAPSPVMSSAILSSHHG
jgi:hypothetical protein